MKYLVALFLFVIALFCGSVTSHAQDDNGFNFHTTVLDPPCSTVGDCFIVQNTDPFPVVFTQAQCIALNNPPNVNIPDGPDDGCFLGINDTGETIMSLSLL